LHVEPTVSGEITWSGRTLTFRPASALTPGTRYTVTLDEGARAESGRTLLDRHQFSFVALGPRVAYLAPVDGPQKNIWVVDPNDPSTAHQLTHSTSGILSFDVSPDGGQIAYAESNDARGSDLKLLNLDSGETRALTTCGNGICTDPVWSPDGSRIAFSRQAASVSPIPGVPRDDTRVWLVDSGTTPPRAAPLFSDPQVRAHYNPRWSPDGSWIAVSQPTGVSNGSAGVLLYNFATTQMEFFPTTVPPGRLRPMAGRSTSPAWQSRMARCTAFCIEPT
jgi:Tol biopolymer transport system component